MLAIRLKRTGRRNQPSFRVVVAEKRSKATGASVEEVGHYNPVTKEFAVKEERVRYWLSQGAQPTVTVHNLLVAHHILEGKKIPVKIKARKKQSQEEPQKSATTTEGETNNESAEGANDSQESPQTAQQ
ncbi:30S ribosomal protein S16 [Candidatus Parcubacteria bacterium]|nr:MAG: 30S ribosomal protein S16 [Candidatus Parcubacteria bacterium]